MSRLRHIAVHVEEPEPGRFAWVLTERDGPAWHALDTSQAQASSYQAAMAAGLWALQSMVEDLELGPRDSDPAAEGADQAPAQHPDAPVAAPPAPGAKRMHFGFGPAR